MTSVQPVQSHPTTPRETNAIHRTVNRYALGLRNGSVKTLKEAFRPQALVSGYIERERFVKPVSFLYEYVRKNASPAKLGADFRFRIDDIAISGKTATVRLSEHNYLGFDYTTYLQLMKIGARWWIVSKLFNGIATSRGSVA